MAHDIFISYSSMDKSVADSVCAALEQKGIRCWIAPRDVMPGQEYAEALVGAINSCRILILILSEHSNRSPQVLREAERAVSKAVPILPLRIDDVTLSPSMEYYVSSRHWLDAMTPPLERHLDKLTGTVLALLQAESKDLNAPRTRADPGIPAASAPPPTVDYGLDPDDLSEDEFGGGAELSTTGFLVFGLLTFWIYNVWTIHGLLTRHLTSRLNFFKERFPESNLSPEKHDILSGIERDGFQITTSVKYITLTLYSLCILLFFSNLAAQHLFGMGWLKEAFFNYFILTITTMMAFFFCISSVWFLAWVLKTIKNHEYNELLLLRLLKDPENFKVVRPSQEFIKRWNRNQNWLTFFLVISFPLTLSPIVGVFHIFDLIQKGGSHQWAIWMWSGIIFTFAAIFHLWGTRILLDMYHQHLKFETENRGLLL